jgi:hypothetical protein
LFNHIFSIYFVIYLSIWSLFLMFSCSQRVGNSAGGGREHAEVRRLESRLLGSRQAQVHWCSQDEAKEREKYKLIDICLNGMNDM